MKDIDVKWEEFHLTEDKAKELKIEEPSLEDEQKGAFFSMVVCMFGDFCSVEELWKIVDIVYAAFLRKNSNVQMTKGGTVKISRIKMDIEENDKWPQKTQK